MFQSVAASDASLNRGDGGRVISECKEQDHLVALSALVKKKKKKKKHGEI